MTWIRPAASNMHLRCAQPFLHMWRRSTGPNNIFWSGGGEEKVKGVGDPTALFKTRTQPREGWEKGEEPCPPKAARRSPYLIARGDDRKRAHSLHWIYKTRST
ncbi:unnamed protein product [Prorocentrum cordatum]|uniref:Uncharacterized protein n=1 Tax=Prorocentrum cordatum TaxID=2364126 RepID=A0ABN9S3Z2_9DINO|nr:unnamed protein product [Polarella glacialis]